MQFPGLIKGYNTILQNLQEQSFVLSRISLGKSEICRGDQEIMLHFHESWLLTLEFPRGVTQFYRISKGKASFVLSRIAKGKVTNLKDPGLFFLKSMSSIPLVWIFLE